MLRVTEPLSKAGMQDTSDPPPRPFPSLAFRRKGFPHSKWLHRLWFKARPPSVAFDSTSERLGRVWAQSIETFVWRILAVQLGTVGHSLVLLRKRVRA